MPSFAYNIRTAAGQTLSGVLNATDATTASATLRQNGSLVLGLEPTTKRNTSRRNSGAPVSRVPFVRPRIATLEVALRQLSVMLESGLTLLEALRSAAAQSSPLMRATLIDIAEQVQQGRSLTQAIERHRWTGRMVGQLIEVGEQTGTLDVVLARAADALEKRRLIISKAIAALLYPTIVFVAAIIVAIFMLVYAVPRLTTYLSALGRPLPAMTQAMVDASNFLMTQWPVITGSILLMVICFSVAYATPPGRLLIDAILLRIPIIGYILRTSATAMFSRTFSLLLASGVTIIEALRTCEDLHRNRRLAVLIAQSREQVIAGEPLAPGMAARKAFTPMLSSMIAIGERSGNLDDTLLSCAEFHEQRLEALIRTLSSIVEVVIIVVVGGLVGYMYIAFMMALYGAAL
ncbi:MAG: type II secretion system F family protein [Planctomycetota bacterium]